MKASRVFQLTALALVLVAAVQVGWWILDQHAYTVEKVESARTAYAEQTAAAQALLDAGTPAARVAAILPAVTIINGRATLAAPVAEEIPILQLVDALQRSVAQALQADVDPVQSQPKKKPVRKSPGRRSA